MKIQIFTFNGHLGATSDLDNGVFINDPKRPGQLGVVASTSEVQITKEAKELIKGAKREGGSFAPIMLTKHSETAIKEHGKSSIGLMGFIKHYFGDSNQITISRDCDLEVLNDCEEIEMEAPEDFKGFINKKN